MAQKVNVVAIMKIKPESIETARPQVEKLIEQTRQEKGCLRYDCFQDAKEPGTFVIIEEFADQAAFQAHRDSEHFKSIGPSLGQWLNGPSEVRVLKPENIAQK